ncbi:MAG: DUF350 domain-containing protein [Bacteroidota bacterium]
MRFRFSSLTSLLAVALSAVPARAQEAADIVVAEPSGLTLTVFLSTLVYGAVGILMCVLGYVVFDKVAGLNLKHELVEDQNTAVGIMLAGAFIGIAIVVAAVMLS